MESLRGLFRIVVATGAMVASFTTGTVAITAGLPGTVAIVGTTLASGSALTLYIAFGLGLKSSHREAILACLLIYLNEFHLNGVALLQTGCGHIVKTVP